MEIDLSNGMLLRTVHNLKTQKVTEAAETGNKGEILDFREAGHKPLGYLVISTVVRHHLNAKVLFGRVFVLSKIDFKFKIKILSI